MEMGGFYYFNNCFRKNECQHIHLKFVLLSLMALDDAGGHQPCD